MRRRNRFIRAGQDKSQLLRVVAMQLNLRQLRDNFFRLGPLNSHSDFPIFPNMTADQFRRGIPFPLLCGVEILAPAAIFVLRVRAAQKLND